MAKFKVGDKVNVPKIHRVLKVKSISGKNYVCEDILGTEIVKEDDLEKAYSIGEIVKDRYGHKYKLVQMIAPDAWDARQIDDNNKLVVITTGSIVNSIFTNQVLANAVSRNPVVNAALNAVACNADVQKALNGKIVCNGIGDCFADAVFDLEKAVKMAGKAGAKSLIKEAKNDVAYVTSYDWADTKDKQYMKKCLSAIDKALSNPTEEAITAARWECEKARAYADGGSPSRAFWNSDSCNEVAKNKSPSVKMCIDDLTKAINAASDAESEINNHPDISRKIAQAHKLLVDARNEVKSI